MLKTVLAEREFVIEQLVSVPLKGPIYTCTNGHYTDENKKCPTCKSKVVQCNFLETLLEQCTFNCPHRGCGKTVQGNELLEHSEAKCHYRPIACSNLSCQRFIPFWKYFEHLEHGHGVQGVRTEGPMAFVISTGKDGTETEVRYIVWNNHVFLVSAQSSFSGIFIWVQFIGNESAEKEFVATLRIEKKPQSTQIEFPVTSIRADFESIQRRAAYAHLSIPELRKYVTTGGDLLRGVSVAIHSVLQLNDPRILYLRRPSRADSFFPDEVYC